MKQTIRYFTADSPSQPAGRWRITAQQSVQGGDVLSQTFCFAQGGLRYALPANAVYEVFPKEQQMGDFSQVLPHILLRGWNQKEELCLLLLTSQNDFSICQGTLQDFTNPPQGVYAPPLSPLEILGESANTPCTQLLLTCEQLRAALPAPQDQPFLRHLRQVSTLQNKAAQTLEDGTLLCLFSHRPPPVSSDVQKITLCLVNMAQTIPLQDLPPETTILLPLLHHWSFQQSAGSFDFGHIARGLSAGYLGARKSQEPLLQQGFIPMQHHLRGGGQTVSWYRGPLVPIPVQPRALPRETGLADAYTLYDPACGMLDVSRSAAWQLGRLLTLRSGHFTNTLQKLRSLRTRYLITRQSQLKTSKMLGTDWSLSGSSSQWSQQLDMLCAGCLCSTPREREDSTAVPSLDLRQPAVWHQASQIGAAQQQTVDNWLDNLCLLQDVPFSYLVPDESMLLPESLQLFYLDTGWIAALRQGALSVGRQSETDAFHDLAFWQAKATVSPPTGPQGFLLRSQMVKIWAGLEVYAYTQPAGDTTCRPLRLERLRPDVLLGIFDSAFCRLEFVEPAEELHISCEETRMYRDPVTGKQNSVPFTLRFHENGTVDFAATAAAYPVDNQPMTPDLLALQLVQTSQKWVVLTQEG